MNRHEAQSTLQTVGAWGRAVHEGLAARLDGSEGLDQIWQLVRECECGRRQYQPTPINGRKIIFRYAKDFSATFRRDSQPVRIIIVWKYQSESGQPASEDHQRMNQLEDMLESVLKDDSFATLAVVSTGENFREWIYYAGSEAEFEARFDDAVDGMPAFPIEIHIASDPTWDTYQRFKAGVKQS